MPKHQHVKQASIVNAHIDQSQNVLVQMLQGISDYLVGIDSGALKRNSKDAVGKRQKRWSKQSSVLERKAAGKRDQFTVKFTMSSNEVRNMLREQ